MSSNESLTIFLSFYAKFRLSIKIKAFDDIFSVAAMNLFCPPENAQDLSVFENIPHVSYVLENGQKSLKAITWDMGKLDRQKTLPRVNFLTSLRYSAWSGLLAADLA